MSAPSTLAIGLYVATITQHHEDGQHMWLVRGPSDTDPRCTMVRPLGPMHADKLRDHLRWYSKQYEQGVLRAPGRLWAQA